MVYVWKFITAGGALSADYVKKARRHSTSSIHLFLQRPGGDLKGQSRGLNLRATPTDKHLTTKTIVLAGLLVCDAWLPSWWSCVRALVGPSHAGLRAGWLGRAYSLPPAVGRVAGGGPKNWQNG